MTKSKFAIFIDCFFVSFLIFFALDVWINSLIKNAILSIIFSIFTSLLVFALIFISTLKKHNLKLFKESESKFLQDCLSFLTYTNKETYIKYLENLLSITHIKNYLFKSKTNDFIYIQIKTEVTDKDFEETNQLFYKHKNNNSKLYFLVDKKSTSFDTILSHSKHSNNLINIGSLTKYIKEQKLYPISKNKITKMKFSQKLKLQFSKKLDSISRKHFKEFFFSGISLLALSLIIPFRTYYRVIGTILIIISILCIFKKDNIILENKTDISSIIEKN